MFFSFGGNRENRKKTLVCVKAMGDGIPDEGGLECSAINNQEINRSGSGSDTEDSTPRSGRVGPRLGEHGKSKAGRKSAGGNCEAGRSF
jgi:hypothetical protein